VVQYSVAERKKKTKEPFMSYKSFHIFSRFSSSVIFGDTSFFSNSQKLHALFPTICTLPEKLNYITIHPSEDSTDTTSQHSRTMENNNPLYLHSTVRQFENKMRNLLGNKGEEDLRKFQKHHPQCPLHRIYQLSDSTL